MMRWLHGLGKSDDPVFEGERIIIRPPEKHDWENWYYVRQRSRHTLTPWEATWHDSHMTQEYFHKWVRSTQRKRAQDRGYFHFIFLQETGELMGGLNILHVIRGIAHSAALGYWMGHEYSGNGFMSEAFNLVLPYGYEKLGLHRYQAAIMEGNTASRALVQKFGFREEGVAERFLKVNGQWRDHIIYALTSEEWEESQNRRPSTGQYIQINA